MAKFKITILDPTSGVPYAEIAEAPYWPAVNFPMHTLTNGHYGVPIRVELIQEASVEDTYNPFEEK